MVLLVTFHYLLATLSSYAFARLLGAGRLGAVYAGLAFGVSGYLLARSQALGLLTGAAWLAACVAAAQYAARREGRGASPLVLAGALALSVLGGSQQLTAVAATAALLVLVLQLRWRGLAIFVGAGAAALALAAVALLPRLELVGRSTAANGVIDPAGYGKLAWSERACCSAGSGRTRPSWRRSTPARSPRPGAASRSCAAGARRGCRSRSRCSRSPGRPASRAGSPIRSSPCARSPSTSRCARCRCSRSHSRRWPGSPSASPGARPSPWLVAAFALGIALAIDPGVLVHGDVRRFPHSRHWPCWCCCARRGYPPCWPARSCRRCSRPISRATTTRSRTRTSRRRTGPRRRTTFPQAPATARFLLQQRSAEGPTRFAWLVERLHAPQAAPLRARQRSRGSAARHVGHALRARGRRRLRPAAAVRYHDAVASSNGRQPSDRHFTWVERAPTRLLRRLGVRYYVAAPGLEPAGMTVVLRTPQATVVRDDKALPLARVNRPGRTDPARILVRDPDRVVIATPPGPAGRLVLADPPYPGWSVTVDGHSAPVRDQDGLFRAVDLPAGRHTVEWRFEPRSVKSGSSCRSSRCSPQPATPSSRRRAARSN